MKEKKISPAYRVAKWFLRLIYGKVESIGLENIPQEPAIYVSNHAQLNGPISSELFFPVERYTWCVGDLLDKKDARPYVFQDFWSQKPKRSQWYYKLMSYVVAPILHFVDTNANTIGVYHDARLLSTFKETIRSLQEGKSVVIFPEQDKPHNGIVYDFQEHFIDVAKLYYKRTGKEVLFVPFYVAPRLRQMHFGAPTRFSATADMDTERERIRRYLMDGITELARNLPEHTVVPYRNIPRKLYPKNTDWEVPAK